jgi:regulator of protease activity HflC (stomatin/prohibitin superfamily)
MVLSTIGPTVVGIVILVGVYALYSSVVIVRAYEKRAHTVLGDYRELLEPGLNIVPPFISKTYRFDMRTQTIDVPRQEAITEDNSPVTADAVVYIKVMDAKKAFLEVDDYKRATSQLAQTTLRAVLGDMALDDTLNKRQTINARIQEELAGPTDEWGIMVESVEVREVNPSKDVQAAMEKQTSAERKRRAMILEARGERRSAVEEAQGMKESNIIKAQGEKQSQILEAQGDSISTVLKARASEAMGERAVIDKSLDTLEGIGQGDSTKFVIPQELSSLVGRYGKHLSGSDVESAENTLDSLEFDQETEEMLGLDDIEKIVDGLEDEVDEVASDPNAEAEIADPDSVVDAEDVSISDEGTSESNSN